MAKSKKSDSGVREVSVEDSAVQVFEVVHPGDETSDAWHQEQADALNNYRLTGDRGVYLDPTRDQEPDIAPELGVAPHPELANPAPAPSSFSGRALDVDSNPVLVPVNEKVENSADATEAYNELVQAREEAFQAGATAVTGAVAPQPVYMVDNPAENAGEGLPVLGPDESAKTAEGDPSAQESNSSDPDAS